MGDHEENHIDKNETGKSVNEFGMEKKGVPPSAPAAYPGPGTSDGIGGSTVTSVEVDTMPEINPPPSYDSVFTIASSSHLRSNKSNPYKDDRNMWEKAHDCFEMSVLQQIIWLIMLAFSISYIFYGIKYSGQCYWIKFNEDGDKEDEENLTTFIRAEGGVLCATILVVFLRRITVFRDNRRKKRLSRPDMDGKKFLGSIFLLLGMGLYITVFGLCIGGATKIYSLYDKDFTNYTSVCHPEFYNFYYNAKIGQLAVLMPYAAYILVAIAIFSSAEKRWFLHHKWRQWVRILDADQDGVISADDMEKTNAKLEQIRLFINCKDSAPSEEEQKKWWNDHVFKCGPGKDICLEDYICYLEGFAQPHERPGKFKPIITQFFDFFSTEEYRKKNLILGERDFVKFWTLLLNIDERHCRNMFIKHVPSPLTLASLLDDFVALVSHDDVLNNDNYRLLAVLKQKHNGCCSKA